MRNLARWPVPPGRACDDRRCGFGKAAADADFYADLRARFRFRPQVDAFRARHFTNRTVLGVHIRAGNGEGGDFAWKKRGIRNETAWLGNLAGHLRQLAAGAVRPALFVASDTERLIDGLRDRLGGALEVLQVAQRRPAAGTGILFGEKRAVLTEGEHCLHGWEMSLVDMILLSHADAVVVGRPSSFTQTMPMSLVFARPERERRIARPYCELDPEALHRRCYASYEDWCCNGTTAFYMDQRKKQEYIHVPQVPFDLEEHRSGLRARSSDNARCLGHPASGQQYCIPYHWGAYRVLPNRTIQDLPPGSLVQQVL